MLSALMGPSALVGMDILGCSARAHHLCGYRLGEEDVSRAAHRGNAVRFYLHQSQGTTAGWV